MVALALNFHVRNASTLRLSFSQSDDELPAPQEIGQAKKNNCTPREHAKIVLSMICTTIILILNGRVLSHAIIDQNIKHNHFSVSNSNLGSEKLVDPTRLTHG